jgi:hypothetical protein
MFLKIETQKLKHLNPPLDRIEISFIRENMF